MFVKAANQTCDTCLYCQIDRIPGGNWYATIEEVLECRYMPEPVDKKPNDWCGQWKIKS